MSLKNRVVIVTGGGKGIGKAISQRLAKDGYFILINYNSSSNAAEACKAEIIEQGGVAETLQFNVSNREDIETKLDQFFEKNKDLELYGLINNAGITRDTLTGLMSDEDFTSVIDTNLTGNFYISRYSMKKMLLKKRGSIVSIASLSGQTGNAGQINYAASKAGVIAMTKTLSKEVGRKGIRVNCVAPGIIETEMIQDIPFLEELKKSIPLKRAGAPDEIAGPVSFLLSDDSSYITGQTISVNGGLYSP